MIASIERNPIANIICFGRLPPFQMFPVHSGSELNIILTASQKANQSAIANQLYSIDDVDGDIGDFHGSKMLKG